MVVNESAILRIWKCQKFELAIDDYNPRSPMYEKIDRYD